MKALLPKIRGGGYYPKITPAPHRKRVKRKTKRRDTSPAPFQNSSMKKKRLKLSLRFSLLFVPLVDGLQVAEDDLVLALAEVVGHRRRRRRRRRAGACGTACGDARGVAVDAQTHQRHVTVDDLAQVADVVAFRLHQFLIDRRAKKKFQKKNEPQNGWDAAQRKTSISSSIKTRLSLDPHRDHLL